MGLAVSAMPPGYAPDVLEKLRGPVKKMLQVGGANYMTFDRLRERVETGDLMMWVVHEDHDVIAGVLLSACGQGKNTTLIVEGIFGNRMDEWIDMVTENLKSLCEKMDAGAIEASCRPGLARILGDRGWKRKAMVMELS